MPSTPARYLLHYTCYTDRQNGEQHLWFHSSLDRAGRPSFDLKSQSPPMGETSFQALEKGG